MTDFSVKRDYWDRPWIMPPGAGPLTGEWREGKGRDGKPKRWWWSKDAKAYSRASGAGKGLDTKEGLIDWAACQAAVGVILNASARSEITTLLNEYDDPWNSGDEGGPRSGKSRLKAAVEQARNTAGQHTAASAGTEFHKLGELRNKGETPRVVQDHLKEPLARYERAVEPIEFIEQEVLVVNDALELCGSVDYLMGLPAGITTPDGVTHKDELVVVGDLKTGKWDADRPMSVTCQLTAYGTGMQYDQETNTRTPLHPMINNKWGLMVHFPIMKKNPEVKFYWVDLTLGLEACLLAKQVEAMRARFSGKDSKLKELDLSGYDW